MMRAIRNKAASLVKELRLAAARQVTLVCQIDVQDVDGQFRVGPDLLPGARGGSQREPEQDGGSHDEEERGEDGRQPDPAAAEGFALAFGA